MDTSAPVPPPLGFDDVLRAERAALRPGGGGRPLSALCLSGGGIRSATFALGALQRLAQEGLLAEFDYLSTVSGGGYIGAWLTAWIHRAGGLAHIAAELRPNAEVPADQPDPIAHLRAYNNYLTPRLGLMSADTWTVVSTFARNVFLNWLVFVPVLLAALMAPRLLLALGQSAGTPPGVPALLAATAALLLVVCLWNIVRYLPGVGGVNHTTRDFLTKVLAPLALAAALFTPYESLRVVAFWPAVISTLALCLAAWTGYLFSRIRLRGGVRELPALASAVVVMGLGLGVAAWRLNGLRHLGWPLRVTLGPPLLLAGFALAGALFVGLSSRALGTQDREWMARAAAYLSMVCAVWLAACAAVLLAPGWIYGHPWKSWTTAAVGAIAAWASSHVGFFSPPTSAPNANPAATARSSSPLGRLVLLLAPPVCLTLVAVGLGIATDWMLAASHSTPAVFTDHLAVLTGTPWYLLLLWACGLLLAGRFMARFVNINKFSLQGMYRDRLIRAYLGASKSRSSANRFTGFSTGDDIAMHTLDPELRPLHVVNMTLNLVAGERLAWQQRKAESFTVTALHCGSAQPNMGFRPARDYGGRGGITLGTAVAISGAAASPNMGYHSSPLVGFIMTLFNLRLGAWLGNPGPDGAATFSQAGPVSATRSLLREALGQTTDASPYVYLSDGGHFENLGLYEMIRRRCHNILVLDAGCDPGFTFEDLGNALRKIRIDMRVPIEFTRESRTALHAKKQRWATAKILYSAADPECPDGHLIYLKPMLLMNEPPDVLSYAAANPTFPHQSTADQWFDESQTESYRMLGLCSVAEMCEGLPAPAIEALVEHLTQPAAAAQAAAL